MDVIDKIAALSPKQQICFGIIAALLGVYVAISATISGVNLFTKEIDQIIGLAIIGCGLWYAVIWHYQMRQMANPANH